MRFGRVGVRAGLANLAQLRLNDDGLLLEAYCRARGLGALGRGGYYRIRRGLRSAARHAQGPHPTLPSAPRAVGRTRSPRR